MIFLNQETLDATVELAHFGPAPLTNASFNWRLTDADRVLGEGRFTASHIPWGNGTVLGQIRQPLAAVNPATFWHTDWSHGPQLPARLDLELPRESLLRGFVYVPRQDMNRGRIARYHVEVSRNGIDWLRWAPPPRWQPDSIARATSSNRSREGQESASMKMSQAPVVAAALRLVGDPMAHRAARMS